jgi:hypothetical protein
MMGWVRTMFSVCLETVKQHCFCSSTKTCLCEWGQHEWYSNIRIGRVYRLPVSEVSCLMRARAAA